MGVEEVHTVRIQFRGDFDFNEAEEGEEDSSSGEEDLGGRAEEDMGDSRNFNKSGSSGVSRDDSIVEGAMVLGGGDRATIPLEGDMAIQGPVQVEDVNLSRGQLL